MRTILITILAALSCEACAGERRPAKEFLSALGRTSLTFYPACVRTRGGTALDREAARRIASFFEERGLAKIALVETPARLSDSVSFNQARMYRLSERAFAEFVKTQAVRTDYAAAAEILVAGNGQVGGIHLYVVRADGTPAWGLLVNSHFREFRAVKPRSAQDAARVLTMRLENELGAGSARGK